MKIHSFCWMAGLAVLAAAGCGGGEGRPVGLVEAGRSLHQIVLEPDASPSEEQAAAELVEGIKACTGVELPVRRGVRPDGGPMIVLGRGPAARSLDVDPEDADLGEQGYAIRTVPPHLVIAGSRGAGTLYGVGRFLQEEAGLRWYAPEATAIPHRTGLSVGPTDRLVRPAFLWRHTSYEWPGSDDAFLARQADNAGDKGPDDRWGLEHAHDGRAHSYHRFVGPDEFFDTHPEYFSEIGGRRVRDDTQLCLTNPEVLEIVTDRMLARMAEQPGVRQHNFSQMDRYNYCQCDRCRAMNERYRTAGGTQFWFVSELARRTAEVFPGKQIGTLAYMYTEEPPTGLELHPNVAVWLCHMYPSCDSHPIASCPRNADYKRRAEAWSKLTRHLYIWHYVTNFTHYYVPFPNLRAMAADMRFYRDIGVEGVYLQGMGHAGGGGEWSLLRPWYGMQLLWDPDQDPATLLADFLNGYYGPAAPPLAGYIDLLHDTVERDDVHMHLYTNPAQGYLTDAVVAGSESLFAEAATLAAADPVTADRVAVAHLPLEYIRIFPRNGYAIEAGRIRWLSEIATLEEVNLFIERLTAHGFTTVREQAGDLDSLMLIYLMLAGEPKVHTLRSPHLAADIVPKLGGRLLRLSRADGTGQALAWNVKQGLFFPFAGGLEFRAGEAFDFYGWVEPASVVREDERSITLASDTLNGFRLERTFTLDPDRPVLHIAARLVNTGDTARTTRLRAHLELALGPVRTTRLAFDTRGGGQVDQDMTSVIAGMREGEHFLDTSVPDGAWRFSGGALALTWRFDPEQVEQGWVYAYPEELGEVEAELWGDRVTIPPGGSVEMTGELELTAAR